MNRRAGRHWHFVALNRQFPENPAAAAATRHPPNDDSSSSSECKVLFSTGQRVIIKKKRRRKMLSNNLVTAFNLLFRFLLAFRVCDVKRMRKRGRIKPGTTAAAAAVTSVPFGLRPESACARYVHTKHIIYILIGIEVRDDVAAATTATTTTTRVPLL